MTISRNTSQKQKKPMQRSCFKKSAKPNAAAKKEVKKLCKICKGLFIKRSMSHVACSPACAQVVVKIKKEKAERKAIIEKRQELKSRSQCLKEAQAAVNKLIREIDADEPCISCRKHKSTYDAGHFRGVKAMSALRFDPDNIHKQCVQCNQHESGNIVLYRLALLEKVGVYVVDRLEKDYPPVKYSIEQAKKIKIHAKFLLSQVLKIKSEFSEGMKIYREDIQAYIKIDFSDCLL